MFGSVQKKRILLATSIFTTVCVILSLYYKFYLLFDLKFLLERDLAQDYLMGKALKDGLNPYQSIPNLLKLYFPAVEVCSVLNFSPHSPFLVLLFSYFSFLSIQTLSIFWYIFSILCLSASFFLLSKQPTKIILFLLSLTLLSLPAIWDLLYGQFNCQVLFLCCLAYYLNERKRPGYAGIPLGICISLKYFGWIFLFYFLYKRNFKLLFSVLGTTSLSITLVLANFEYQYLAFYFKEALPKSFDYWINAEHSISLVSLPYKIIYPITRIYSESTCYLGRITPPYPAYLKIAASAFSLICIACAFKIIIRSKDGLSLFSSIMSLSVIASPISWLHYALALAPSIIVMTENLDNKKYSSRSVLIYLLLFLVSFVDLYPSIEHMHQSLNLGGTYQPSYFYVAVSMLNTFFIYLISIL